MKSVLETTDVTEAPRRARLAELNIAAADRQELGLRYTIPME